jgi:hypothetical protein
MEDIFSKSKLTDQLKEQEMVADEKNIELKAISSKLNLAYDYENDLILRQQAARQNSAELQIEYINKKREVNKAIQDMKSTMDVFTGNFF